MTTRAQGTRWTVLTDLQVQSQLPARELSLFTHMSTRSKAACSVWCVWCVLCVGDRRYCSCRCCLRSQPAVSLRTQHSPQCCSATCVARGKSKSATFSAATCYMQSIGRTWLALGRALFDRHTRHTCVQHARCCLSQVSKATAVACGSCVRSFRQRVGWGCKPAVPSKGATSARAQHADKERDSTQRPGCSRGKEIGEHGAATRRCASGGLPRVWVQL